MTLEQIIEGKPDKKEMVSNNLVEMVKNCMKKDIINLDLVHTALLQVLQISSPKLIEVARPPTRLFKLRLMFLGTGSAIQRSRSSIGPYKRRISRSLSPHRLRLRQRKKIHDKIPS
jgi:hypothetical protein